MSAASTLLLLTLGIIAAGLLIALAWLGFIEWRRRRRSAWNRRFTDARFTPRQEDVNKLYVKYQAPTYLRTRAEEERLMPRILRRQAE